MSDSSYGIVVDQLNTHFRIWTLFSGTHCHLTLLDSSVCKGELRIGDVVRAKSEAGSRSIYRWLRAPDSVWSDGRRVVVRTIVSYSDELTSSGRWKDEMGLDSVLLFSRDIGTVTVPAQWYRREFFEAQQNHLFAYVQFSPQSLKSAADASVDFFWTIVDDRICLPATPSRDENPADFLQPDQIHKVPALTLQREGDWMLMWSYALGDHLAIAMTYVADLPLGRWLMVTVIRSSARDFASHGCTYTVIKRVVVAPCTQPEVTVARDTIQMAVNLNRSEPDPENPGARMKLWHVFWGLPIDYDDDLALWIRGEKNQFRALIQIGISQDECREGRRAVVKVVAPSVMPRLCVGASTPAVTTQSTASPVFEDVEAMKKAIQAAERNNDSNNGAWSQSADQTTSTASPVFEDVEAMKKAIQAAERATSKKLDPRSREANDERPWTERNERGGFDDGKSHDPDADPTEARNIEGPIPIRLRDDVEVERQWRRTMQQQGWAWPAESAENLLRKRSLVRNVSDERAAKVRQCLITKVRFDADWREVIMIQLFILDYIPAVIEYKMSEHRGSLIKYNADFRTVGNVVELRAGRNSLGWYVVDGMWRLVSRVPLPMREGVDQRNRTRLVELIVTAKCLNPNAQDRHNDRHRRDNKGFIMLLDEIIHNVVYYGTSIDAREHNECNFQMFVVPEECLKGHAFWLAKEPLWRIAHGPGLPKERPPEPIPAQVRESTIEDIFFIYGKLMENDNLMEALRTRTGMDYKKKFSNAIAITQHGPGQGLKNRHKRERECNENFLISIVENLYTEDLFRDQGEKKLWKLLVKTVEGIKDWRRHVNNR